MVQFLIGFTAIVLFLLEPVFGLYSPFEFGSHIIYIVPRFFILFLIYITIYYSPKQAMIYAFIFGLLYDVFYIDIIGLYVVLYPSLCFVANMVVQAIHKHLLVSVVISLLLLCCLEFVIYQFNLLIGYTHTSVVDFASYRLIPTLLANSLFVVMLVWVFNYLIRQRVFSEDV